MEDITTVVLTGGPGAGKSMVAEALKSELGDVATFVPEAATLLLRGGFPSPDRGVSYTPDWLECFQRAIALVQLELEEVHRLAAREHGHRLLILDRGLLDGVAFVDDAAHWTRVTGLDPAEALKRYDHVIHLMSLAVSQPRLYDQHSNQHRRENLAESAALCHRTQAAWLGHHSHYLIENDGTVEELIDKVRTIVNSIIGTRAQSGASQAG